MGKVGQREKLTQKRVVKLFKETLRYSYLGDWSEEQRTSPIEVDLLKRFISENQSHSPQLIDRALTEFQKVASNQSKSLYDLNKEVYALLRYGIQVKEDVGESKKTVYPIDWKNPEANHFAVAEEVSFRGESTKRPDVVMYVNGIAVAVLELKRSTISVSEGIRQNLDNQKREFIRPFFTTVQLLMAGNDTEGLRYGTIETPEKYYLTWKEESEVEIPLADEV